NSAPAACEINETDNNPTSRDFFIFPLNKDVNNIHKITVWRLPEFYGYIIDSLLNCNYSE
ncbi:MAG TPA: hypothetical protein PLI74_02770, partial [Candidatus Kapabacteria bacterium]|nr:hypothetical protein [Candidatus Kapabacteria bacterium]